MAKVMPIATILTFLFQMAQAQVVSPFHSQQRFVQSPFQPQNGCFQHIDPHTFECHQAAFAGVTEFPVVPMDWNNAMQGEWFAVTYAVQGGNDGFNFMMDKNPMRPSRPGRGVFNRPPNKPMSLLGSLFIHGSRATFSNWQGQPMTTIPGTVVMIDPHTQEFKMNDHMGIQHLFQCRDFIRNGGHHLTCRWFILRQNGEWQFAGYFGFLSRQLWDQFVQRSRNERH